MLDIFPFEDNYTDLVIADLSLHYFREKDTYRIISEIKRKMLGGILYLISYALYFGVDLLNNAQNLMEIDSNININLYMNLFMSLIGMIIPIAVMLDLLMDKNRKNHPKDKKTDWFYNNEQFDRKLDERADKNNYKTF